MTRLVSTFFQLPQAPLNLALTLAAGIAQSFGLAMFVPVLTLMNDSDAAVGFPFNHIEAAFGALGVTMDLPALLLVTVVLITVGLALNFAQRSVLMAVSMMRYVRQRTDDLIGALLGSGWPHLSKLSTGEVTNQLFTEIQRAGRALTHLVACTAAILQAMVFIGVSAALSFELLLIALGFGASMLLIVRPLQRYAYKYGSHLTTVKQRFGFHAVDYLQNLKLIKATSSEERAREHIYDLQSEVCHVMGQRQINLALTYFVTQAFPVLLIATIIYVSATVLATETTVVLVFLLFLARVAPLMSQFQQEYQAFIMERPAIQLVDALIEQHRAAAELATTEGKRFASLDHEIRFENVSYVFEGSDTPAVRDLSIDIGKGDFIALVGGSGAGKSTVIDLLCALRRPTSGSIRIDGDDLSDMNLSSWRRKLGYVTQDVAIFNDTIRNNIAIAAPDATDAEIADAISIAQLSETIDGLPDGLDTVMGEGGVRLSGGQKQRLALARALVGNPSLLLLDEATSALDNESERLVQDAIDAIAHRFTIVVVAHRLSTVRKADRIYVMENGAIVETGTYDSLVAAEGRFAALHGLQFQ